MDIDEGDVTPIDGGWCVKSTADGTHCIDVMKMMFNYRVQLTPIEPIAHLISAKGYCYFGHGED